MEQLHREIVANESENVNSIMYELIQYSYYFERILQIIYTVTCLLWLLYVICVILYLLRRRITSHKGVEYSHYEFEDQIFKLDETLSRFVIFFVFLFFETIFCLSSNIYTFTYFLLANILPAAMPVEYICVTQLDSSTSDTYEHQIGVIILNFLFSFENFSFTMMIWVLTVFQLHLCYASRNELRIKQVCQFLLFGLTLNFVVLIFMLVPYTNILGKIAQTIMSIVSYIILLYVGKYKCIPALKDGVKEACRVQSNNVYHRKNYLRQFKILFIILSLAFLIFLVRDLISYNIFIANESVVMNPCWLHDAYNSHYLNMYVRTINFVVSKSQYLLVLVHVLDSLGCSFFIAIKMTIFSLLVLKFMKKRHSKSLRLRVYRLNQSQLSTTLLS